MRGWWRRGHDTIHRGWQSHPMLEANGDQLGKQTPELMYVWGGWLDERDEESEAEPVENRSGNINVGRLSSELDDEPTISKTISSGRAYAG